MAETLSKSVLINGIFSIREMIILTEHESPKYIIKIHDTFLGRCVSRRRPKTSVAFPSRNVVIIDKIKTAKVVVLIPPAVDPGDPPIIIRMISKNLPDSVKTARSTVLNPAVLELTDWNNDIAI